MSFSIRLMRTPTYPIKIRRWQPPYQEGIRVAVPTLFRFLLQILHPVWNLFCRHRSRVVAGCRSLVERAALEFARKHAISAFGSCSHRKQPEVRSIHPEAIAQYVEITKYAPDCFGLTTIYPWVFYYPGGDIDQWLEGLIARWRQSSGSAIDDPPFALYITGPTVVEVKDAFECSSFLLDWILPHIGERLAPQLTWPKQPAVPPPPYMIRMMPSIGASAASPACWTSFESIPSSFSTPRISTTPSNEVRRSAAFFLTDKGSHQHSSSWHSGY